MAPKAKARGLRGLWIALAAVSLTAVATEVGLRVVAHATHRVRGLRFDPDVGWRPIPGVVKVGRFWSADEPARINSVGLRDAEHPLERPPGVYRIVALGDSFAYGAGVDYGERFSELLEAEHPPVEVINFGFSAYSPDQELRLLERDAIGYSPDLVLVVVFLGNDLRDLRYERRMGWPKPHYELVDGRLRLEPPVATWDVRLRTSSYLAEGLLSLMPGLVPRSACAEAWREEDDTRELLVALLVEMERVARDAGARALVALAYPRERAVAPATDEERDVREALESRGLAVLDLHAPFARAAAAGRSPFVDDGHWNPEGHALVAEAIAERLRAEGWLAASR